MNMQQVIQPKSDQINADDLPDGQTLTITITDVKITGGQEQPVSIYFAGSNKAFRPCKSMCRVLVAAWGLDAKEYVGKSLTLYTDPTVTFGPLKVGGLRISHMSHIDGDMEMALMAKKGLKKAYKVRPLRIAAPKPDKVADGVCILLERIRAGEDVDDDPAVAKQRKWLEANRPELFAEIEAALAERDPFEGPSDSDRGEPHALDANQLIDFIGKKATLTDLASLMDSHADTIAGFSDEDRELVEFARAERAEKIRAS